MRYPFVNRRSLRFGSPRFCSLRPLLRPPPRNHDHQSQQSAEVALFSTSSSICHGHAKGRLPIRGKAPKPTKAHLPVAVSAKDGTSKHQERASPRPALDDISETPGENELEFTEEDLMRSETIQLPTRLELSKLPGGGEHGYKQTILRSTITSAVRALGGEISINHRQRRNKSNRPSCRAVITANFPKDNALIATGDGFPLEQAMRAAILHALAKMRARGLLTLISLPAKKAFPDEKSGLLEVYNYAARYQSIPDILVEKFKAFFSITIHMPEHDINVAIRNVASIEYAEAAAAHEFKRQAELYRLSQSNGNAVVRDRHVLSTDNVKDFFAFCRDTGEISGELRFLPTTRGEGLDGAKPLLKDLGFDVAVEHEVRTGSKQRTKLIVPLVAAVAIAKTRPHLFDNFSEALRAGDGKYLEKLGPKELVLAPEVIRELDLIQTLQWPHQSEPSPRGVARPHYETSPETRIKRALTSVQLARKSSQLKNKLDHFRTRSDLESLRQLRSELPMTQYASQVRQIVHDNVYCIIIGATGSGKTTQVPQILLDEAIENGDGASCNIICTQPRRIAATSVARRVALERAEKIQDTVGYHVRGEGRLPNPGGSIIYCTSGILLQRLLHDPDDVFDRVSHLVIDEVHDRELVLDFLLITLKNTLAARVAQGKKLPRVVFMSATIEAEQFAAYFRHSLPSEKPNECPALSVPGRTFPVQEYYLDEVLREMKSTHGGKKLGLLRTDEDTVEFLSAEGVDIPAINCNDEANVSGGGNPVDTDNAGEALLPLGLVATTVAHIAQTSKHGAILVFLPGLPEITKVDKLLRLQSPLGIRFDDALQFRIIMLHSSLQDSQKSVFDQVPEGCRKIILSTNIAETSVTIPDVRFVVDTGKSREKHYDQKRRITALQTRWISKSNAKQRAGRAGRVQDGVYYALFTRSRREWMRAVSLPELLRSDLQETCLDVKVQAFKMPVADFLAGAMEPPPPSAVDIAIRNLISLGALTEEEDLTALGRVLASLPVHPSLGKMILLGIIFRCLDPMIILGAAAQERPLIMNPLSEMSSVRRVKRWFAWNSASDHFMLVNAFSKARELSARSYRVADDFFSQNFISHSAYKNIQRTAHEIVNILAEAGLIENELHKPSLQYGGWTLNENSNKRSLIRALLVSGLYPNLAFSADGKAIRTAKEKGIQIHPSSVNNFGTPSANLFTFNELSLSIDRKSTFLRDVSSIRPLTALLFGGPLVQRDSVLHMDGWLPVSVRGPETPELSPGDTAVADKVMFLRRLLDRMLASTFNNLASHKTHAMDRMRRQLTFQLTRVLGSDSDELGEKLRSPAQKQKLRSPAQNEKLRSPAQNEKLEDKQDLRPRTTESENPAPMTKTAKLSKDDIQMRLKKQKAVLSKKGIQMRAKKQKDELKLILRRLEAKRPALRSTASRSTASRSEAPRSTAPKRSASQSKTRDRHDTWDRFGYQEVSF
ncbi:helicase associated domain-containing protein [Diaporthe helianthi]|uniref:Helicase associated domain-containing protein n=1 Tax=Diaporthe helianthi TaxID=158607 RepID=A0A2P5I0C2_DIAHE|nr:helicase associated domain-containing protein [Diaporthe helianthi]